MPARRTTTGSPVATDQYTLGYVRDFINGLNSVIGTIRFEDGTVFRITTYDEDDGVQVVIGSLTYDAEGEYFSFTQATE